MLLLRHYKTQLLGRFNAFWSYFRGRLIVRSASREFFTDITRARMMCECERVCAHVMCVRVRACARAYMTPPFIFFDPP